MTTKMSDLLEQVASWKLPTQKILMSRKDARDTRRWAAGGDEMHVVVADFIAGLLGKPAGLLFLEGKVDYCFLYPNNRGAPDLGAEGARLALVEVDTHGVGCVVRAVVLVRDLPPEVSTYLGAEGLELIGGSLPEDFFRVGATITYPESDLTMWSL